MKHLCFSRLESISITGIYSNCLSLVNLREYLVQQHMVGIELFKKFPGYDVSIHVTKKEKAYTAHTVQQWEQMRDLLRKGYSLR